MATLWIQKFIFVAKIVMVNIAVKGEDVMWGKVERFDIW
jgi:hypothetical protein